MSTPLCAVPDCGRPSPDAFLCPRCTTRLEKLLAELPADLRELEITVTRQANAGRPEQTGRGKPGTIVLYDPDDTAAKLADQARNGLSTWIRHLCEQRGLPAPSFSFPPGPTSGAMAVWLTGRAQALAHDEAAGECYQRMHELRGAIRRAIDNLAKRWAGPCTARLKVLDIAASGSGLAAGYVERDCGADLRTRPGAKVIRCDECGAGYDPVDRLRWILAKAREHHGTAGFCAAALTDAGYHVTEVQIRKLASRGKLFSYREDDDGRPLYLLGDLIDMLASEERRSA